MKTIYVHHLAGYVRAFVEIRPGIFWECLYANNPRSAIGGVRKMTNTKHTPGPWQASFTRTCARITPVNGGDGAPIATVYDTDIEGPHRNDADLIASAPDQLALHVHNNQILKHVKELLGSGRGIDLTEVQRLLSDAVDNTEAAIAKARGES